MPPSRRRDQPSETAVAKPAAPPHSAYDFLRLDDSALLNQSREQHYRSGGPGGQRRNKVETAVRLRHSPTGIVAHSEESRSPRENRARALRRLRKRIALEVRQPLDPDEPALTPEFLAQRGPSRTLSVNRRNPVYPVVLATVLDALAAAGGSYASAARMLGLTTSQLVRFLRSDPEAWRTVAEAQGPAKP